MNMEKVPPVWLAKTFLKVRSLLERATQKTTPSPISLLEIVTSQWISQAVLVAAELDVAGYLKDGPRNIAELAKLTDSHEESLYRILRTLAAKGIFRETEPRVFGLNALARPLLKDSPDSVYGVCMMNAAAFHANAWSELRQAVKTGQSVIEQQQGKNLFEYLSTNPKDSQVFDDAMTGWATQSSLAVATAIDFSKYPLLVDVGGGRGNFLGTVLSRNPTCRGLLFDQPHVVSEAAPILTSHGVADRCEVAGGSFFESVPGGGDAYFLKNIIHDWDDDVAVKILSSIRKAMKPSARLFLVESVVPEGNTFHAGKLIDLEMLVCTPGGKERTVRQFEEIFKRSGLRLQRIHQTAAIEDVIEIAPATGVSLN